MTENNGEVGGEERREKPRVVVQHGEVLRAVLQFLRETGLVNSMRALEQECGVCSEPLSVEMYCLRDMTLRGQWRQLFKFLAPLEGVSGLDLVAVKVKICKQEFLEQLRGENVDPKNTFELVEHYKRLVLTLQQLATLGLTETEHRRLSILLTLPETALQKEFSNWNIAGSRLELSEEIILELSKVLGKGRPASAGSSSSNGGGLDSSKDLKGRLVQLVAKGLLYERCEKGLINGDNLSLNGTQLLDFSNLLTRMEGNNAKVLDIVCEKENTAKQNPPNVNIGGSFSHLREKNYTPLERASLTTEFLTGDNKNSTLLADMLKQPRKKTNGFNKDKIDKKMINFDREKGKEIDPKLNDNITEVIIASTKRPVSEGQDNSKPPLPDPKSHSVNNPNNNSQQKQKHTSGPVPKSISDDETRHATPLSQPRIYDIPIPGCDSSTPKPDKVRSAITPLPDESPIQPIQTNTQTKKQDKQSSLSNQSSRQQRQIVRKLDLDGTSGATEPVRDKEPNGQEVDVSGTIPKAVQWMVGLGKGKGKDLKGKQKEKQTNEIEIKREMRDNNEMIPPGNKDKENEGYIFVEKKVHGLTVSDETSSECTPNKLPENSSPKLGQAPPYVQLIGQISDEQVIRSVSFHPHQKLLAVGANSKRLYLCQYYSHSDSTNPANAIVPVKCFTNYHKGSVYCLDWNREGSVLASASNDQSIHLLKLPQRTSIQDITEWEDPLQIKVHSGTVRTVGFLTEKLLASGGAGDSKVRIVDLNKHTQVLTTLPHGGQINEVYAVSEHQLVSAAQDEKVRVWDVRSSECVWEVASPAPPSSVCSDTQDTRIAVSCEDGTMLMFDRRTTKCFYSNRIHRKDIRSIRFKPATSDTLLTGSYDGEIKLTYPDIGVSHQIGKYPHKIIQCRFSEDAKWMVNSSTDKTVRLWEFSKS